MPIWGIYTRGWRGLKPGSAYTEGLEAGGRYQGTVTCEAIRRSVGDSEAKAGRKRKREKSSVIAARRSIRSSLFSPGSPGAFDFATCTGRCRSEDDGDQRGEGHDGPRDWSMGPVDDEIGTEGGERTLARTSTRTETQAGSDRRTGRRRQLF